MKTPHALLAAVLCAATGLSLAGQANAALAYSVPDGTVGTQTFDGALGMEFDVSSPSGINVTGLGAFDSGGDGLNTSIMVGIFDRNTGLLTGPSVTLTGMDGTAQGGHRVVSLSSPLFLPAGFQGTIVGQGYNVSEPNGNFGTGSVVGSTDDGGGLISFVGTSRFGPAGVFDYPGTADAGPENRYHAGTFTFDAVPEPAASTLLLASAGLLLLRRRRA